MMPPASNDKTIPRAPYYADESVTLYHGDCREIDTWLEADVLVTDPPYGIGWRRGVNPARGSKAHPGIVNDSTTEARDGALKRASSMPAVVFGSLLAPYPANVKQVLIWHKPPDAGVVGSTTGFRRDAEAVFLVGPWPVLRVARSSVLRSRIPNIGNPSSPAGRTGHPHSKPLDLMEQLIAATPPGVIADPFAGSGATLLAARAQGRQSIGVEIEERYCEIIAKRFAQGDLFGGVA